MQTERAALTEALFVAKVAYRELNQVSTNATQVSPPVIIYNDMMRLASGSLNQRPHQSQSEKQSDIQSHRQKAHIDRLMSGINNSLVLRKQYSELVKRLSFATSPALAAASTQQEMPSRQTDNMLLKFKRDSLETTQIFALLSIHNPSDNHHRHEVVVNVLSKNHCERIEFPPLIDGTTQCLFDKSDPKLQFLLDLDAEISIMP